MLYAIRPQTALAEFLAVSRDASVLPMAIQAIEQFGWEHAFESHTFMEDWLEGNDTEHERTRSILPD